MSRATHREGRRPIAEISSGSVTIPIYAASVTVKRGKEPSPETSAGAKPDGDNGDRKTYSSFRIVYYEEMCADARIARVENPGSRRSETAMPKPGLEAIASAPPPNPSATSPLSELDQWVSAERLLEILWDERSRPSLKWVRKETKRRMLPHLRRGRLIYYRPRSVLDWFNQRECRPHSMK